MLRTATKGIRVNASSRRGVSRWLATQSGDDTRPPTALAKIHLEDGTTLLGKSFGAHTSVEGEVSMEKWRAKDTVLLR